MFFLPLCLHNLGQAIPAVATQYHGRMIESHKQMKVSQG
jgi:hypothetical protein